MTDAAEQILHRLGLAIAPFVEAGVAELSAPARAALAEQLAGGDARLCIVVDLEPFAARLILHRAGEPPLTLAALLAETPADQLQ